MNFLALLTIVGDIVIVFLLFTTSFSIITKVHCPCSDFIKKYILEITLLVSLIATLGSLYLSEIAGYAPCTLCWYQRILIYPQALILWLALFYKDKKIVMYMFFLSLLGAPLSLYHYLLQRGLVTEIKCTVVGYSSSCSQNFGMFYGYITIPFMALTAFSLILIFTSIFLFKKS